MKPLAITDPRPVSQRLPSEQTIRERAEFLAFEIFNDRLAPQAEIADAIEREIRRFAGKPAEADWEGADELEAAAQRGSDERP